MIADIMPSLLEQIDGALSDGKLRADAAENIRRILSGEESDFAPRAVWSFTSRSGDRGKGWNIGRKLSSRTIPGISQKSLPGLPHRPHRLTDAMPLFSKAHAQHRNFPSPFDI